MRSFGASCFCGNYKFSNFTLPSSSLSTIYRLTTNYLKRHLVQQIYPRMFQAQFRLQDFIVYGKSFKHLYSILSCSRILSCSSIKYALGSAPQQYYLPLTLSQGNFYPDFPDSVLGRRFHHSISEFGALAKSAVV